MKNKIFALIIAASLITISASSQTIKNNMDKLAKDKATTDKAAKADVLILSKTISDSTQTTVINKKNISTTSVIKSDCKKHTYKKRRKITK